MTHIILLGGSFNPGHTAHLEVAKHIYTHANNVDEIWYLVGQNPHKDPAFYAPLAHRMEIMNILANHYPDIPVQISDFEFTS